MAVYTDLNALSPTQAPLMKDVEAIYQSLYTLFNTRKGESIFNPDYGVELEDILFEIMDDLTALEVNKTITEAIEKYEPRVIIDQANTKVESYPDENRYELTLVFSLVGIEGDQNFTLVGNFTS